MISQANLDSLANQLRGLDGVHGIEKAQDLETAKRLCSASKTPKVLIFHYKSTFEPPKDWLNPAQQCDQEYGVLINEKQVNRPRKGHHDETLHSRIITALMGFTLNDASTPMRLKSAESVPAPAPQSLFLLVFSSRTIIESL